MKRAVANCLFLFVFCFVFFNKRRNVVRLLLFMKSCVPVLYMARNNFVHMGRRELGLGRTVLVVGTVHSISALIEASPKENDKNDSI